MHEATFTFALTFAPTGIPRRTIELSLHKEEEMRTTDRTDADIADKNTDKKRDYLFDI